MTRRRSVPALVASGLMTLLLLAGGAAALAATAPTTTDTGVNEAGDGQTWTWTYSVNYSSLLNSGGDPEWKFTGSTAAQMSMSMDVHYVDAPVYYRACILHYTSSPPVVKWESSPQTAMDDRVLDGTSGDGPTWGPVDSGSNPLEFSGGTGVSVSYKTQTTRDNGNGSQDNGYIVAKEAFCAQGQN